MSSFQGLPSDGYMPQRETFLYTSNIQLATPAEVDSLLRTYTSTAETLTTPVTYDRLLFLNTVFSQGKIGKETFRWITHNDGGNLPVELVAFALLHPKNLKRVEGWCESQPADVKQEVFAVWMRNTSFLIPHTLLGTEIAAVTPSNPPGVTIDHYSLYSQKLPHEIHTLMEKSIEDMINAGENFTENFCFAVPEYPWLDDSIMAEWVLLARLGWMKKSNESGTRVVPLKKTYYRDVTVVRNILRVFIEENISGAEGGIMLYSISDVNTQLGSAGLESTLDEESMILFAGLSSTYPFEVARLARILPASVSDEVWLAYASSPAKDVLRAVLINPQCPEKFHTVAFLNGGKKPR